MICRWSVDDLSYVWYVINGSFGGPGISHHQYDEDAFFPAALFTVVSVRRGVQ